MSHLPRNRILIGDAAAQLHELPASSVDTVITSPPYFRLRNYQVDGQLGLESRVEDWVAVLRAVVAEVARVLVPTGNLWLNLGDTYSTHRHQGAGRKSLLMGPERLALTLMDDGWLLRNKLVWAKSNGMPTSVRDRLSAQYEIIYLLVRSPRYHFDLDAIRLPHRSARPAVRRQAAARRPRDTRPPTKRVDWRGPNAHNDDGLQRLRAMGWVGHPLGKNPGDVWLMSTSGYRGAHFATFPEHLAERMIAAGSPERRCVACRSPYIRRLRRLGATAVRGALEASCSCCAASEPGLVLDPFMGAGTTAVAAQTLGRDWLGIELNPDFARLTGERVAAARSKPLTTERKEVT